MARDGLLSLKTFAVSLHLDESTLGFVHQTASDSTRNAIYEDVSG
jgi:hypothetical protein